MKQGIVTPHEQAEVLLAEYSLHPQAVQFQSAYILGAQEDHLDALRIVRFFDGPKVKNPEDPDNPAESQFRVSWNIHVQDGDAKQLKDTLDRREALMIASALLVHEALFEVTGELQPVQTPKLYAKYFPNSFGKTITFRNF